MKLCGGHGPTPESYPLATALLCFRRHIQEIRLAVLRARRDAFAVGGVAAVEEDEAAAVGGGQLLGEGRLGLGDVPDVERARIAHREQTLPGGVELHAVHVV